MKYALNLEPEALGDYSELDEFEEEATDSFWELDEYSDHECESCSEFDPEYDESEWEAEIMRGNRVPQRQFRTRPGMRRPQFRPRVIRRPRPGLVIADPSICTCPAPNCPRHGNEYVRWVQSALNQIMNLRLSVTGIMNAATRSALRSFQEKQGLPVDGIAGPETMEALIGAKGGKSLGAGATKSAEPGMTEPSGPAATTPDSASAKPATEFDFEWESFNPDATRGEAASRQDQIAFEAELGVGETPFGEIFFEEEYENAPSDVQAFAVALGAEWSKRRNGDPSSDAITAWLLKDYQDTLDGARRRWGKKFGAGPFTVEAIGRAWKVSRTENMKFQGGSPGVKGLGKFDPPAMNVALVTSTLIEDSDKAPVAPLVVKFVEELRRRYSGFVRASNYRGHGGGKFNNRGYSLDLFINGLNDRGFYSKDGAVKLLRAVHEAASAVGAQWRVIYNDFEVADVVNRALGRQHVIFVGSTRKTGTAVTGLNWHGPAPLILHFHLDLAPLADGSPSSWKGVSGSVSSSGSSSSGVPSVSSAGSPSADTVRFAQRVLNATERERLDDDGDLGQLTRGALARFRTRYGLGLGGVLDGPTELALVQRTLEELAQQSIFPQFGVLDAKTGSAIARFKSERGLGSDATIDAATRRALADALVRRTTPARPSAGAKVNNREVGDTLAMAAKQVPGLGITLEELLVRHQAESGDIPIEVLLAFIHFEAGTRLFDDVTAGKWNEKYQKYSPSFYELGVFQTPAGDHGCIREGSKKMCKYEVPGHNVERSQFGKGWYRLKGTYPTKDNWRDPTMQVRIGLWDLRSPGERVAKDFPALFPSRRSEWYLRMAVLYSFSQGAGWTRAYLSKYMKELLALPENKRWDFLRGKPAYLKGYGTKTKFDPENVDKKMALAAKLRAVCNTTPAS